MEQRKKKKKKKERKKRKEKKRKEKKRKERKHVLKLLKTGSEEKNRPLQGECFSH